MKVLGFIGPKGAGKDEAAKLLKEMGKSRGKLAFAGPLKNICSEVFQLPIQYMNDPVFKEKALKTPIRVRPGHLKKILLACESYVPSADYATQEVKYHPAKVSIVGMEGRLFETPRQLLQVIGTDFIRDRVYKNFHVEAALSEKALAGKEGLYCVTDIRFTNELEALREAFGDDFVPVYIERPEAEERLAKATHPSELVTAELRQMIGETNVIKNDGSVADLKKTLSNTKMLKEFYKRNASGGRPATKKTSSTQGVQSGKFVYGRR